MSETEKLFAKFHSDYKEFLINGIKYEGFNYNNQGWVIAVMNKGNIILRLLTDWTTFSERDCENIANMIVKVNKKHKET